MVVHNLLQALHNKKSRQRRLFRLFDYKWFHLAKEGVTVIAVDVHLDWLGKVQAENPHDGFCIYCISAGN